MCPRQDLRDSVHLGIGETVDGVTVVHVPCGELRSVVFVLDADRAVIPVQACRRPVLRVPRLPDLPCAAGREVRGVSRRTSDNGMDYHEIVTGHPTTR